MDFYYPSNEVCRYVRYDKYFLVPSLKIYDLYPSAEKELDTNELKQKIFGATLPKGIKFCSAIGGWTALEI